VGAQLLAVLEALEPLDESSCLVTCEAACGLALVQPEGTAGVAEVGMTGPLDERPQLVELAWRRWWTGGLPECHGPSLADGCLMARRARADER
jgi:hypothetical protein